MSLRDDFCVFVASSLYKLSVEISDRSGQWDELLLDTHPVVRCHRQLARSLPQAHHVL